MAKSKEFEAMKGNLKHRSVDEVRKMGRKGGIKSGESRRLQKSIREAASYILAEKIKTTDGEDVTKAHVIANTLCSKAAKGDLKAIEILLKHLEGNGSEINVNVEDKAVTFRWVDA